MSLTPEERREHKRQAFKRWAAKNREKLAASKRRYYANNKERFRKRAAEAQQRYRDANPGVEVTRRIRARVRKAGRPKPDRCEVCGGNNGGISWDHCHQRGVFRGWLCNGCNAILGFAHDDPNRLRMLIAYLERTKDLMPPQLSLSGI